MSKLPPSSVKFSGLALAVTVAMAGLIVLAWPFIADARHYESRQLVAAAARADGQIAESDLLLAHWFSPHDDALIIQLAQAEKANGHMDAAIQTLGHSHSQAGEAMRAELAFGLQRYSAAEADYQTLAHDYPSDGAYIGLAKAQLEQGNTADAAAALAHVTSASNQAYVLDGLIRALEGAPSGLALMAPVASPGAAQAVARAQSSKLALAQELYALGLLNSAQRVLETADAQTTVGWQLLANIALSRATPDLTAAKQDLQKALALDPANRSLRQQLINVLQQQHDTAGVTAQQQLLGQLPSQ